MKNILHFNRRKINASLQITSFSSNPSNFVLEGESVELSVSWQNSIDPSIIQWRKDGTVFQTNNTSLITNQNITINNFSSSDVGDYDVVITDSLGRTVTSDSLSLGIVNQLVITQQPQSQNVIEGEELWLQVNYSGGTPPYNVTWKRDGNVAQNQSGISGNISALVIDPASNSDAGDYTVEIMDSSSSLIGSNQNVISDIATVNIIANIQFVTHPQTQSIIEGENFQISGSITGGQPNYIYKLILDGIVTVTTTSVSDTSMTFTINNASSSNTGQYQIEVEDSLSQVAISNIATISLITNLTISTQPQSQTVNENENVTFNVTATGGTLPYSYQWRKDGVNITGATSSSYTINNATTSDSGDYSVVVSDSSSQSVTSDNANLEVSISSPLTITMQPQTQTVTEDGQLTLQVAWENGAGPFSVVWSRNGNTVNTQTGILEGPFQSSLFGIVNIQPFEEGNYTATITDNNNQQITSDIAIITVNPFIVGDHIFLGGSFSTIRNASRHRKGCVSRDITANDNSMVRNWSNFQFDTTFTTDTFVRSMSLDGSNIYIGGRFTSINNVDRNNLVCIQSNTTLSSPLIRDWNPNIMLVDSVNSNFSGNMAVNKLLLSGENIYIGGVFNRVRGFTRSGAACVEKNPKAAFPTVRSWNPNVNGSVNDLILNGNNMYIAGNFNQVRGTERINLACVDSSVNSSSPSLRIWDPSVVGGVTNMLLDGDHLWIAGGFSSLLGSTRRRIACISSNPNSPAVLRDWNADIQIDPNITELVQTMILHSGNLYFGGQFSNCRNQPRQNVACIEAAPSSSSPTLRAWHPSTDFVVNNMILIDGNIFMGGVFTNVGGTSRNRAACISSDISGHILRNWNPNINSLVSTIIGTDASGGIYY